MKPFTGKETGIIRPKRATNEPRVGPDALMVMIPSQLNYLVGLVKATSVRFGDMNLYRLYQTTDGTSGLLTLAGPFVGAPQAVMGMEKLIAMGAKRIWVLGWCGSLRSELRIGHVVIPTTARSEEGTSTHYPLNGAITGSDMVLNGRLEKALLNEGVPFTRGPVWTTDAPYRETPGKVRAYGREGILAVEMEMSALMTLACYRKRAVAGLLVVSDELFDLKWRPGFSTSILKRTSRLAGKALLAAAFPHYRSLSN